MGAVSGTISAAGRSASTFVAAGAGRSFNLGLVSTSFVGTVQIERSFDNGATWQPCTRDGATVTFTGAASEVLVEPEQGVLYAVNCTAYTSGSLAFRFGQAG